MPVDLALMVTSNVLGGLIHAHAAKGPDGQPLNLIHRDITPGNVLLSRTGDVKLSDFGVARATGRMTQTVVGEVKGKYSYMAPEVMQGDAYDQRSDVWGMGVVCWESLTTRPMFRGKSDFHVMEAVLRGPLYAPSTFNPGVPKALDAVVMQALERDVSRRFESARAFRKALAPLMPKDDLESLAEKLAELVSRFHQPVHLPASNIPVTDPALRLAAKPANASQPPAPAGRASSLPAPAPAPAGRASTPPAPAPVPAPAPTPAPSSPRPDWLQDALAGAPEEALEEGAAAFDALFNPEAAGAGPAPVAVPEGSLVMEPPPVGEPGFYAVMGADRQNVGPVSVRSAAAILQRPWGHPTDKLGLAANQLLPLAEVGRLLLLDHLVKLPVPAQKPNRSGTLDEGIPRLLLDLSTTKGTGLLTLSWGPQDAVAAFLVEGHLQYAFQADPTNHLLALFVQHQQRGLAMLPQILAMVMRDRMPLTRAMAKVAQLSGARITQAVATLARDRVGRALVREGVQYAFYPGAQAPYELPMNRDPLLALLPFVMGQVLRPQELATTMATLLDRPMELTGDSARVGADLGLSVEVQALRQALGGQSTLRPSWNRLVAPGSPDEARWMVTLVLLRDCGLLKERAA